MPALSRKSITILLAVVVAIVAVLMLTACGNDIVPSEQPHEAPAPAAPAPAAPAEPAAPAAPAAPAEPEAAEEPEPRYSARCYSGTYLALSIDHLAADDWGRSDGEYHFTGIGPGKKEEYFGGPCLIEQE